MRKGHSITGLQVIAQNTGKELGKVVDLIFDHDANECLALLLREKGLLHSAQVVRYENIVSIGRDAVIVSDEKGVIDPLQETKLRIVMERDTNLSGTKIISEGGQELGVFSDVYLDELTGKVVGYEVSGGLVTDTMSGKRYIPAARTAELRVGEDVLIAPDSILAEFQQQAAQEPGGLKTLLNSATEKVVETYGVAKEKATETYSHLADASIEKQKAFVIGKTAGKDVYLPAPSMLATDIIVEDHAPLLALDEIADDLQNGPVLIHKGETITAGHADHAEGAGILHELLLAAGSHATGHVVDSTRERLSEAQMGVNRQFGDSKLSLEAQAIGRPAGKEVYLPNGSTLVAPGMTITVEMMETARLHGLESELVASAGIGTASTSARDGYSDISATANNIWETIKEKTAELTGMASEKKAEHEQAGLQKRINNALGRPVNRVILAKDDTVILNTGDIVTHKAVELAHQSDMLDVLLDSVNTETPEISPDALRVAEPGQASLAEQSR